MSIQEFSEKHGIRLRQDELGEMIIPGRKVRRVDPRYPSPNPKFVSDRYIGQIYEYGSGKLGIMFIPRVSHRWNNLKKKLIPEWFKVQQNGDWEGSMLFDPENDHQAKLAIASIGAKKRRVVSGEQLEILRARAIKNLALRP